MPLILLCGIPASGKTTRALELQKHISSLGKNVVVVNEESMNIKKQDGYQDSPTEKMTRAALKASVDRSVSKEIVVISDSLNYIKGYRYEIFCLARAAGTPYCVVWCDTPKEAAGELNDEREDRFSPQLFQELVMRFEPPNMRNKWDSPLFIVRPGEELPIEDITCAILEKKGLKPNAATKLTLGSSANFVHELESITQDIMMAALETMKSSMPGDFISVPHTKKKINMQRNVTLSEFRRLRKQCYSILQAHPLPKEEIGDAFVDFLNTHLT